eukprot:364096_1
MSTLDLIDSVLKQLAIDPVDDEKEHTLYIPNANDVLEINNCINRYMQCLDNGDGEGMANLFIKYGKCEVTKINKTMIGTDAIASFCVNLHEKFKAVTHFESNVIIQFENSSLATNRSYWRGIDGNNTVSYGVHKDTFMKDTDTHWKFSHRVIEHIWSK